MKTYGLNDKQVQKSREKYGSNRLTEQKKESFLEKYLNNLNDPIIRILIVALGINLIFVFIDEQTHWYEPAGIFIAIFIATIVSTISEYSNENVFQKLQEEASKILCKVYRNGVITEISLDDVVVDDDVMLQTGDKIPADGFLVNGSLKVDQSTLNGESEEAKKLERPESYVEPEKIDFLDEFRVFRGTVICSGEAVMRVSKVGDSTVYGKITEEIQIDDRDNPLKVKLNNLAKAISKFGYIGAILIAISFMFNKIFVENAFNMNAIAETVRDYPLLLSNLVQAFILAVIIIVMAVPEGLPLMIAIVSSLNMKKMLDDKVLVRKIAGIETAGSLNILFSDKTGTITKGHLETVNFINGGCREYGKFDSIDEKLKKLLYVSVIGNSSAVKNKNGNVIGGNATERALINYLTQDINIDMRKISMTPFNSAKKYSFAKIGGEYNYTFIKGAPERILDKCSYYFDENGKKQAFDKAEMLNNKILELAKRAIRVLAVAAYEGDITGEDLPDNKLILIGVMGIRDDIRPESISAIAEVKSAGVQVVMITGDRKETAQAIAKEAGLLSEPSDIILTSDELQDMSDDDVKKVLKNIRVISRALPNDKSRLVRIAQELNLVVGMTGDGVNDAPALKCADVGFAMGSGTEVAKEAGDIVILDDNFLSIEKAILYGRTIYNNIRKFIVFQLSINVSAVLISFISPFIGIEKPLDIVQILWINLIMDTLAAIAFGGEIALKRYMNEKPKRRDENIVSRKMWSAILTTGIYVTALSIFFFKSDIIKSFFREGHDEIFLRTGFFTFFVFISIANAFNARTDSFNLLENITKNKAFLEVIGFIFLIQVIITYIGGSVLRCAGLTPKEWSVVILLSVSIFAIDLIRKSLVSKNPS